MSRSSIFSSETLQLSGFRPYGTIVAFELLLVVDIFLARREMIWVFAQNSPIGIVHAMEGLVIKPTEQVSVLVLGNSRVRDAIIPAVLAEELGISRTNVLNISMTRGTPYDSLTIYRRNREKLAKTSLLIIGVEDFSQLRTNIPSERFRYFSSLAERCEHFYGEARASLIASYCWRTLDAYRSIRRLGKQILFRPNQRVSIGSDGRVIWRDNENAQYIDNSQEIAERIYGDRVLKYDSWALRELLDRCAEDGIPVLLYRPPLSTASGTASGAARSRHH